MLWLVDELGVMESLRSFNLSCALLIAISIVIANNLVRQPNTDVRKEFAGETAEDEFRLPINQSHFTSF